MTQTQWAAAQSANADADVAMQGLGHYAPPEPQSIRDTGNSMGFLADLVLKTLYVKGELTVHEIVHEVKLPFLNVLDEVLEFLKREDLAVISGGSALSEQSFRYVLTSKGEQRVQEALQRCHYVGPAPVPLDVYNKVALSQTIGNVSVTPGHVKQAFQHLVLDPVILNRIGPATTSGRSIFLYGSSGSGKSTIAETISLLLDGEILVPYALDAGGHIIRVYDPQTHVAVEERENGGGVLAGLNHWRRDRRWVRCRRPRVITGGELTLAELDLVYEEVAKYYEAPVQLKANGGMLLIDDFGRQQVRPVDLLNRWMVPLEKRVDYLTLHTGKKIEVLFDVLIVFSTNLAPRELVDDAFLRRIRHKIHVTNPTLEQFRLIMERVCAQRGVPFNEKTFQHLVQKHYLEKDREFRGVHPRDIIEQLIDIAKYWDVEPVMSEELIDEACNSYFVDL